MGRSNDRIHVFLRIRPNRNTAGSSDEGYVIDHTFENSSVKFHVDKKNIGLVDDYVNHSVEDYSFKFDRVFGPQTNQDEVFNMVARDCVASALDGYNSTIFAYGQTGSGKTFSITGGTESYNDRGIIPRSLSMIFEEAARRTDYEYTIRISYLQIYNDKGQDLLNRGKDAKTLEELPSVSVHETDEEVILKGLESHPCNNIHEALNLLFLGDTNRLYCETPMNKTSSRSHCIFAVSLEARQHGSATIRRSKLNLVDLAGSERVGKTGVQGNLLTEAKYINLSLHYLEHVIVSLSEQAKGKRDHIPYRNSFMTMVLRDSLGGNCRTAMLATAHPAPEFFMETISTSKFAQRVSCIRQNAHVNEEVDPSILIKRLKGEVSQLKEQVAFFTKGGADGKDGNREMGADEYERCRDVVQRFIDDQDANANITGVNGDWARLLACFRIMKGMIVKGGSTKVPAYSGSGGTASAGGDATRAPTAPSVATSSSAPLTSNPRLQAQIDALTASLQQKENEISLLFNIVEKTSAPKFNAETQTGDQVRLRQAGASDGTETRHSNPLAQLVADHREVSNPTEQQQQQLPDSISQAEQRLHDEKMSEEYNMSILADAEILKDRQAAFEAFRRSYRKYEQIDKNKQDLKDRYELCKGIASEVNKCVDDIKAIKKHLQQLRADRALQGDEGPSVEEERLLQHLHEVKEKYTAHGKQLGAEKEHIDHTHLILRRAQEKLAKDFEDWFSLRQRQLQLAQQQLQLLEERKKRRQDGGDDIPATGAPASKYGGYTNSISSPPQPTGSLFPPIAGASNTSHRTPSTGTAYPIQSPSQYTSPVPTGLLSSGNRFASSSDATKPATTRGLLSSSTTSSNVRQSNDNHPSSAPPAVGGGAGGGGRANQHNNNTSDYQPSSYRPSGNIYEQQGGNTPHRSSTGTLNPLPPRIPPSINHNNYMPSSETDYGRGGGYGGASQYSGGGDVTASSSRQRVPSTMSAAALQQQQPRSEMITQTSVGSGGGAGRGYRSTGDPEADAQLEAMHRAREEMRARLAASRK